jgi:hypothetical protein
LPFVPRFAAFLAVSATALAPASAAAVEPTGTGENITPIKNIPYPNLSAPAEKNAGTDLEFATITVAGPGAAKDGPGASGSTPAATPGAPASTPAPAAAPRGKAASKKAAAARKAAKRAAARCTASRKAAKKAKSRRAKRAANRRSAKLCAAARKARKRAAKLSRTSVAVDRTGLTDANTEQPGIQRTFSFAGSYGDGLHVIDVTDPANAERVATWHCGISQGDVQVFQREDLGGRWFVTYTHDGYTWHKDSACVTELRALGFGKTLDDAKGNGTYIAEVTDPYNPTAVSFVPYALQSHNMTVHPSGKVLYNSNSELITSLAGGQPAIELTDISDITKPKDAGKFTLKTFPGLGTESHDVDFSDDGKRAYSAALSHGEIIDTTDPLKPKSVGVVVDPVINVWHQTDEITLKDPVLGERKFLIAEDEFAGAIGTGQCPNGGVHVYDITGDLEKSPVKVGSWNISDVGPTENGIEGGCTAHVFQLHEKEKLMTIAYYNGGVRVVDLSGLVGVAMGKQGVGGMREVGFYRFPDSNTWAVKTPQASRNGFYLYGNDHARGFDVYKWTPTGTPTTNGGGIWRSPEQTLEAMKAYQASGGKIGLGALCLINLGKETEDAAAAVGMTISRIG